MKRMTGILLAGLMTWCVAGVAQALDWSKADRLYGERLNDREKIQDARAEYLKLLDEATTAEDKIRAVSQLGRLAIYEGEMVLPKSATSDRKKIFADCWCKRPGLLGGCSSAGFVEKIKPGDGMIDNPAYYYFKGVCLAYWGEANGALASAPHVSTLKSLIEQGFERDIRFEGGGMGRLASGVYSNKQADVIGMYDPEQALAWIDESLDQDPYPGDLLSGSEYYDNWRARAVVLIELQRTDEARSLLKDMIAEVQELIDEGELPEGRAPETLWNFQMMKKHLSEL